MVGLIYTLMVDRCCFGWSVNQQARVFVSKFYRLPYRCSVYHCIVGNLKNQYLDSVLYEDLDTSNGFKSSITLQLFYVSF